MSNVYRSRALLDRDYSAKIKQDFKNRSLNRQVGMSFSSIIGGIAGGVAELGTALDTNIKSWEEMEAGGEMIHKEQGLEGEFKLSKALGGKYADPEYQAKYKGEISLWDKLFSMAPETKSLTIGDKGFYGTDISDIGKMGENAPILMENYIDPETGLPIRQTKSLYDFFGRDANMMSYKTDIDYGNN